MNAQMKLSTQSSIRLFGAWCGPLYMIGLLIGWWLLAGFLPAPPATTSPEVVAATFEANRLSICIGMIVVMYSAMIFIPFAATVSYFLSRIEGGPGVLSYTALLGGCGNMVLTFYPAIWWLVAAFRPDRSADLIYLFNDLAWLQFIGGVSMYDALPLAIAVAAFCDKSPNPVFPLWAGFFNVFVVLAILPDQLLFFFHSGPFSWSGLFGLWVPLILFGGWFFVTFMLMRRALLRERRQPLPTGAAYVGA